MRNIAPRQAILFIFAALTILLSCKGGSGNSGEEDIATSESIEKNSQTITKEQFQAAGMKIGDAQKIDFNQTLNANGMIKASPGGRAKVSALIPGQIAKILCSPGQRVRKGEALFYLEGPEIISLQQEYAEAVHQLKVLEANYIRQKSLARDKIISEKDFLATSSEYFSMNAKTNALRSKLKLLMLEPTEIEKGKLLSRIAIYSPINGIITDQDLVIGKYVSREESLLEIIDMQQLELHLFVYEKDLHKLELGQNVRFQYPGDEGNMVEASIRQIGKSIDMDTKTVLCIASLPEEALTSLVNNLYVQTNIIFCQREVMAIPEESIILEEGHHYVLVLESENSEQKLFRKVPVDIGVIQKGYAEILDKELKGILVEGVYNLTSGE